MLLNWLRKTNMEPSRACVLTEIQTQNSVNSSRSITTGANLRGIPLFADWFNEQSVLQAAPTAQNDTNTATSTGLRSSF